MIMILLLANNIAAFVFGFIMGLLFSRRNNASKKVDIKHSEEQKKQDTDMAARKRLREEEEKKEKERKGKPVGEARRQHKEQHKEQEVKLRVGEVEKGEQGKVRLFGKNEEIWHSEGDEKTPANAPLVRLGGGTEPELSLHDLAQHCESLTFPMSVGIGKVEKGEQGKVRLFGKNEEIGHSEGDEETPANAPLVRLGGVTEPELSLHDLAQHCESKSRGRVHRPAFGICCHFCRQKTLCGEEDCKRCGNLDMDQPCIGMTDCSVCHSSNGVLCRACLKARCGKEIDEVRRNKQWMCPHCTEGKGTNDSSLDLKKQKMTPTGSAVLKGKRDIKVKALEAAKRIEEKMENALKMKKEALKFERARIDLRQMELKKKMAEEEQKKKDADMAARKRLREEEKRKEKERKGKRIGEASNSRSEDAFVCGSQNPHLIQQKIDDIAILEISRSSMQDSTKEQVGARRCLLTELEAQWDSLRKPLEEKRRSLEALEKLKKLKDTKLEMAAGLSETKRREMAECEARLSVFGRRADKLQADLDAIRKENVFLEQHQRNLATDRTQREVAECEARLSVLARRADKLLDAIGKENVFLEQLQQNS